MKDKKIDLCESQLSSRTVFNGRLLHVKEDIVQLPNGQETVREYIQHSGAVVIIPLFENGDILLERQYRYPLRRDFIELPAGKIDPGRGYGRYLPGPQKTDLGIRSWEPAQSLSLCLAG